MYTVVIILEHGFPSWSDLYEDMAGHCTGVDTVAGDCGVCVSMMIVDIAFYYFADFLPIFITIMIIKPKANT